MPSVLITAFGPYDRWQSNASWLCLMELTRDLPGPMAIATRLYPVDFVQVRQKLEADLRSGYDFALHLGQSPGSGVVRLEAIGINVGGSTDQSPEQFQPLAEDGPAAYRSALPLAAWAQKLRGAGIPAVVSYHAGTYLCNATLYWTHYLAAKLALPTQAAFVHLPLDPSQVAGDAQDRASLPAATGAAAVRLMLAELARL